MGKKIIITKPQLDMMEAMMDAPIRYDRVSSPFGKSRTKKDGSTYNHHGVDLQCKSGTPLHAPLDGVIIAKGSMDTGYHNNACGGTIRISHGDGVYTRYCHIKKIEDRFLTHGEVVKKGDLLGLTGGGKDDPHRGNTTGPHLHFEMKINGKLVNPLDYINKDVNATYDEKDANKDRIQIDAFRDALSDIDGSYDDSSNVDMKLLTKLLFGAARGTDIDESSSKLKYHLDNKIPLHENIFRIESDNYFNIINEARELHRDGKLDLSEDEIKLINTDIGQTVKTTVGEVYLDCPFVLDEAEYKGKKVDLNKPYRTTGGPKKFAVYVKNPKTGKVKLVRFGDSNLSIKANDPEAKKSFLARHKCDTKKDRTKAGWWSCNIHLYKKQLGLKFKGKW